MVVVSRVVQRETDHLPTLEFERRLLTEGYRMVAGVDEVGRGSLAGPIVAAAVILPLGAADFLAPLSGVRDSKAMTAVARSRLFAPIFEVAVAVGIGWASHHIIDRDGIGPANRYALQRAVLGLRVPPDALLLDHFSLPDCDLPQLSLSHGDTLSISIAAASVIAKVVRDHWMEGCDRRFGDYGFSRHKGYGTAAHLQALADLGPCSIHRRSFSPVAALVR